MNILHQKITLDTKRRINIPRAVFKELKSPQLLYAFDEKVLLGIQEGLFLCLFSNKEYIMNKQEELRKKLFEKKLSDTTLVHLTQLHTLSIRVDSTSRILLPQHITQELENVFMSEVYDQQYVYVFDKKAYDLLTHSLFNVLDKPLQDKR